MGVVPSSAARPEAVSASIEVAMAEPSAPSVLAFPTPTATRLTAAACVPGVAPSGTAASSGSAVGSRASPGSPPFPAVAASKISAPSTW